MRGLREGLEGGVGLALDLMRQRRVLDMRERERSGGFRG